MEVEDAPTGLIFFVLNCAILHKTLFSYVKTFSLLYPYSFTRGTGAEQIKEFERKAVERN
jgi:hypothetical protein